MWQKIHVTERQNREIITSTLIKTPWGKECFNVFLSTYGKNYIFFNRYTAQRSELYIKLFNKWQHYGKLRYNTYFQVKRKRRPPPGRKKIFPNMKGCAEYSGTNRILESTRHKMPNVRHAKYFAKAQNKSWQRARITRAVWSTVIS